MCGLKMQHRPLDNEAEAAETDKLRVVEESIGGVKRIGDHDSKGLGPEAEEITGSEGVLSRRSALGIGFGLLLGVIYCGRERILPVSDVNMSALTQSPFIYSSNQGA
jgi:hypothetical protein